MNSGNHGEQQQQVDRRQQAEILSLKHCRSRGDKRWGERVEENDGCQKPILRTIFRRRPWQQRVDGIVHIGGEKNTYV